MTRVGLGAIAVAACSAAAQAQTIRVGDIVTVARETNPRRMSEPHLAIDPGNPAHLLATAFVAWTSGTPQEMSASQRCATFVSMNGGSTWTRHDFPLVDCGDPQVAMHVIVSFVDDTWTWPALERRRAWVMRSNDGGTTFSVPLFVNDACGPPACRARHAASRRPTTSRGAGSRPTATTSAWSRHRTAGSASCGRKCATRLRSC
jgi:hypothetical protein